MNLNYSEIFDAQFNRKSSRVFIKRLLQFQENLGLVVDTSKLKDTQIVLYDDLETWSNRSFTGSGFNIENEKLIDSYSLPLSFKSCLALNDNQYF